MVRAGIDLKLVVVEDPSLKQDGSAGRIQRFKQWAGPTYLWAKQLLTLSKEERAALRFEAQAQQRAENTVNQHIAGLGVKGRPPGVPYLETPGLNEATVVTALSKAAPDLCVVLGTSIIRSRLLSIPRIGTLNAHTSVLPEYRGARSEFWQCYNEDYDNVGITIHFIDKGVDTGNVLFQWRQQVDENPEPYQLRARNTLAVLENYVPVIRSVLEGTARPTPQGQCTTPTYRYRDISEQKRIKLYKRILAKNEH